MKKGRNIRKEKDERANFRSFLLDLFNFHPSHKLKPLPPYKF